MASGISSPLSGTEPAPPALEGEVLTTGQRRKFPNLFFIKMALEYLVKFMQTPSSGAEPLLPCSGERARPLSRPNGCVAGTCEPDLPDTPTCPPLSTSRPPGRVPGLSPSPPPLLPQQPDQSHQRRGHTKGSLPVTPSVETPPSRPDLAMAPSPRSRCSSLTGVWPVGTFWSSQRRQARPCLGAFALAVPLPGPLFPSYVSAPSRPSPPRGLCSMSPSKEAPTAGPN